MALIDDPVRRPFWRVLALLLGLLVFTGHILSLSTAYPLTGWLDVSIRDIVLHSSSFALFTIVYRLSWRGFAGVSVVVALLCSGWGALCETAQLFLPDRQFMLLELLVNVLTPIIVVAIISVFARNR